MLRSQPALQTFRCRREFNPYSNWKSADEAVVRFLLVIAEQSKQATLVATWFSWGLDLKTETSNLHPINTLAMFHDLLGFGAGLSVSGGRFDSAIGSVLYDRVKLLRRNLQGASSCFPDDTQLFHLNDAAVATADIDLELDPQFGKGSSGMALKPASFLRLLKFIGAAATLHTNTHRNEVDKKIGTGGRTFVVLGQRWPMEVEQESAIIGTDTLHTNLAFAEAYSADAAGSKAGFNQPPHSNFYVNDLLQQAIRQFSFFRPGVSNLYGKSNAHEQLKALWPILDGAYFAGGVAPSEEPKFPEYLYPEDVAPISIELFHVPRTFHAIDVMRASHLQKIEYSL